MESFFSSPDQRKQGEAYCAARGYELVETFVDAGASTTNERRPEFQNMIVAGTAKPTAFEIVVVHSFSRFFRDHFELEFYVRKLAKNGIRLLSITQEMGDDPMHVMMRQIMALFDEYQSKENAKHVLRALKENARQGFWNGSLPPIGYRVVAAEQRGAKIKKKLEIDPLHADPCDWHSGSSWRVMERPARWASRRLPNTSTNTAFSPEMAVGGALAPSTGC